MKNSIISIVLFFALFGFVYYSNNELIRLCNSIIEQSEKIEELISYGEWDDAYGSSLSLIKYIKEDSDIASIYINHTDLDNMISESIKLSQYIKYKDETQSQVSANALKYESSNIRRLHLPTVENIF